MRLTQEQMDEIRKDILFFLFRNNYWQSRHCPHVNICNKLSQHSCKHINKELTKLFKDTIGIAGTHGKTTTTSMVSLCFLEANLDPSIQVGSILKSINGKQAGPLPPLYFSCSGLYIILPASI